MCLQMVSPPSPFLSRDIISLNTMCIDGAFGPDNRKIQDDGTAQELTEGDITVMKGHGMSGQV